MKFVAFVRALVVCGLAIGAGFFLGQEVKADGPCTAPAVCTDTTNWSGPQVNAYCVVPLVQCPTLPDGVYCCRPLPQGERPADPQGVAATPSTTRLEAGSDSCSFNGVHDPFCGKSVTDLIGNLIKFLLGAAGALFLAMFVYGGAVWLTAGSSDRHQQAQKTLVNAAAGMLVVILSYTMVSLLVRVAGTLGVSQNNTQPVLTESSSDGGGSGSGAGGGAGSGSGRSTPTSASACNASNFITTCSAACEDFSPGVNRVLCSTACSSFGPNICSAVRSPSDCATGCPTVCGDPRIPSDDLRTFCNRHCTDACAAAFR